MESPSPPFSSLERGRYAAILADPPWRFETYSDKGRDRSADKHYDTMKPSDIYALPVTELAAPDCVLFLWATWPMMEHAFTTLDAWGFEYKTCAFDWMKADVRQQDMFLDDANDEVQIGGGYWTRSNAEPCLLATRGHPKRLNADVRMGIIERRREHSRKPDCIYGRIERLVPGPYLDLFSRAMRSGWTSWGNQTDRFPPVKAP